MFCVLSSVVCKVVLQSYRGKLEQIVMKTQKTKQSINPATKSKALAATSMLAASGDAIEHVVVLMLENRSFDHLPLLSIN